VVYANDPSIYNVQSSLGWDAHERLMLTDFIEKGVIDIGSGMVRKYWKLVE
jgi:hypothetical protein